MTIPAAPSCCCFCDIVLAFFAYWTWHSYTTSVSPWHMFEGWYPECSELPSELPPNNSGVRALVYGLSKTGTKTISKSLHKLGLRSYHSEELSLHIWSRIADRFWLRPENGGRRGGMSHGIYFMMGRPADNLHVASSNDTKVLADLRHEELAASLAGCRVQAVAFDGMENLFWPIYNVSPDAKVLVLDWRTLEEWNTSRVNFTPTLMGYYINAGIIGSGVHGMPWVLPIRALDSLYGSPFRKFMLSGQELFNGLPEVLDLPLGIITGRRISTHLFAGLKVIPFVGEEYHNFYKLAYERIPQERRMSWNMSKHGWEDLCAFLDIPEKDCPGTGLLPNEGVFFSPEQDEGNAEERSTFGTLPIWLLLHCINWYVFRAGQTAYSSLLRALLRALRKGGGP